MATVVGVLHPGAMGSSVAACAKAAGADVCWASTERSPATRQRAEAAGLRDVEELAVLAAQAEVIVSVCPPSEAFGLAESVLTLGFTDTYVDANAIDPATTRRIGAMAARRGAGFVDGGIIGPPARTPGSTVLYLSGDPQGLGPEGVAALFAGSALETIVLPGGVGRASALKMAYAAYTKGSSALLLAVCALSRAEGVEQPLLDHWARTHPGLAKLAQGTARATAPKAWRFAGEMQEIAATFAAAGLPSGFHRAAAELFARLASSKDAADPTLDAVLAQLLASDPRKAD